ncbi:SDR family NAD(P)-dependent oxidoreductase [Pectinatus frisingensis]|jgi:NAD(P)-dependent dehydrogenase (short-subunit alcohol dehydrogenase family)|uniref:SDR family NAD(P)-dependent oxidoreductase n=1 Tax=Pectinatus frisingensis TaxID=865 RepID=UPI0018C7F6DE|nr:SDR family NAD(P)-dependent oxidoreductase [Pectinatus frisingensis]
MEKQKSALIVGASRGLGLAIAKELLERGWQVTGTVRSKSGAGLQALIGQYKKRLEIKYLDITVPEQIAAIKDNTIDEQFDVLFVSAGITNERYETMGEVSAEKFIKIMITNVLCVMRTVEQLSGKVRPGGTIGVMSSGQGSIGNNETGEFEVYRASKAALNMAMRSFATRRGEDYALLLLAPGWVKTDMGGTCATFTIDEVITDIVDTIVVQEGRRGLRYLDRFDKTIRW